MAIVGKGLLWQSERKNATEHHATIAMNVCLDCAGFPPAAPSHAACRVAPAASVSAALRAHVRELVSASPTSNPPVFEYPPRRATPRPGSEEPVAVAELRALIVSRGAALDAVRENAASARIVVGTLLADRLAGTLDDAESLIVNEAARALIADVDRAEASKTAALDASLVEADAVLEKLMAEFAAVSDALTSAEAGEAHDAVVIGSCVREWLPRVTAALSLAAALPRPYELTDATLCVVPSPPPSLGALVTAGISVADVRLEGLARVMRRVEPGGVLTFLVLYTAEARERPGFDASVAISSLVSAIAVDAVEAVRVAASPSRGALAPPSPPAPARWACGTCSLVNAAGSAECMACGAAAPAIPPPLPPPAARPAFKVVAGARLPLVSISPCPERAGATVSVTLASSGGLSSPRDDPAGRVLVICGVTIAGTPIASAAAVLPAAATSDGLRTPLALPGGAGVGWQVPCVSAAGTL